MKFHHKFIFIAGAISSIPVLKLHLSNKFDFRCHDKHRRAMQPTKTPPKTFNFQQHFHSRHFDDALSTIQ